MRGKQDATPVEAPAPAPNRDSLHVTLFWWVYKQLTAQGARLITNAARSELCNNIQAYKPSTPYFKVAEEIGLFDNCFILPDCIIPALPNGVVEYLSDIPIDIRSKYR